MDEPRAEPKAPPLSPDGLKRYWEQPVHELVKVKIPPVSPEWAERHRIYSLLTMALIHAHWNGNKSGADGTYPWRESQRITLVRNADGTEPEGPYRYRGDRLGDRYLGHNIACIAVDENGEIIDFDFNHNELYNSSVEHAESRLLRRIFSLNQIYDHWQSHAEGETREVLYGNVFNGTTIYTSLESCAQCSGIMALANALRVVYLQSDPGQYMVGNILYNMSRKYEPAIKAAAFEYSRPKPKSKNFAPEPVDASLFAFAYKKRLEDAYLDFVDKCWVQKSKPFFIGPNAGDEPKFTEGLTSFLCTDEALAIFAAAAAEFDSMKLTYGDFQPKRSDGKDAHYTNAAALAHARAFLAHAVKEARRGTPHR